MGTVHLEQETKSTAKNGSGTFQFTQQCTACEKGKNKKKKAEIVKCWLIWNVTVNVCVLPRWFDSSWTWRN